MFFHQLVQWPSVHFLHIIPHRLYHIPLCHVLCPTWKLTGSWSAIQGLQSLYFTHHLSWSCALSKWDFRIILAWIPGQVDIGGSGVAGSAARDAATEGALVPGVHSLDRSSIYIGQMATGLEPYAQDNKLWDVKLLVLPWRSSCCCDHSDEVVATHLRVSHTCHMQSSSVCQPTSCVYNWPSSSCC